MMMYSLRVSTDPSKTYFAQAGAAVLDDLLFAALLLTEQDTDRKRIAATFISTAPKAEYTLLTKSKRTVTTASQPSLVRSTSRLMGGLGSLAERCSVRAAGSRAFRRSCTSFKTTCNSSWPRI